MSKKEEVNLGQALDLKVKALDTIKACSEFANYLTSKMTEIQFESGKMSGYSAHIEKAEKELESVSKNLESIKKDFANEQKNQETWRDGERKLIAEKHEAATRDRQEAAKILSDARKREDELEHKIREHESKRKDFEAKFDKVKELVG